MSLTVTAASKLCIYSTLDCSTSSKVLATASTGTAAAAALHHCCQLRQQHYQLQRSTGDSSCAASTAQHFTVSYTVLHMQVSYAAASTACVARYVMLHKYCAYVTAAASGIIIQVHTAQRGTAYTTVSTHMQGLHVHEYPLLFYIALSHSYQHC
jgi:hypothetical protein